ncbi:MAG: HesA/MoeB/ThiF family protein [Paracoccus sp. (in: a-proteobacteria)]|nr:HesA/MoeB/ThiF family protein [Paracoccus sp. (in: a-proteobacteria)]
MALLLPIGLISIAATAWLMGWGFLRVIGFLFLIWLAVLVAMLAAPAAEVRAFSGIDVQAWLIGGAVLALVLGYGTLVRGIRQRVALQWGDDPQASKGAPMPAPASAPPPAASDEDALERYSRHILLREIGGPGQAKLRAGRVLIVGVGGLGAPASLYLAGAGVGHIALIDPDTVSLSNLQRQIIFRSSDAGRPKGLAAAEALRALNPLITVDAMRGQITPGDEALIEGFDLVLDGTDHFAARAAVNAACVAAGVPLIAGAISQWEGQLTTYDPASGGPCMACIFPDPPPPGAALPCAEAGVAGPLPGVIGTMMALEAVKHLTGAGTGLTGQMLLFDGLYGESRRIAITRRPGCPVCSGLEARPREA